MSNAEGEVLYNTGPWEIVWKQKKISYAEKMNALKKNVYINPL